MPIYQYKCADCGHQLEALQKISDARLLDCPACGAPSLTKQVTAAAFKLKGTGWYETDFKHSGAQPSPSASSDNSDSLNKESKSAPESNEPHSTPSSAAESV